MKENEKKNTEQNPSEDQKPSPRAEIVKEIKLQFDDFKLDQDELA